MSDDTATTPDDTERLERWYGQGWLLLLGVTFAISVAVSERPRTFPAEAANVALFAVSAGAVLVGCSAVFLLPFTRWLNHRIRVAGAVAALTGWGVLMTTDQGWALVTFSLYAMCYAFELRLGIALAASVSFAWAVALLSYDAPLWTVGMPLGVFVVSSILALTIQRVSELNIRQTELISELRATQRDLVASERTKGVLAERTRMAAEIHDTLAQGFTSIVLLSRAGMRSGDATEALKSIEETAQENLADARRLIEAIRPPELGAGSLPMALERQLDSTLPDDMDRHFAVEGEPRSLNGAVEVTVLRAAQEALLNIRTHARADRVEMVLRFTDEAVVLDVSDNGVGFTSGEVADRGDLTGGQGLALLRRRAESLSGKLVVGPTSCAADGGVGGNGGLAGGSQVSLTLPVTGP